MPWLRTRTLWKSLKLDLSPTSLYSESSWRRTCGHFNAGPKRFYANGIQLPTQIEKILLDTIKAGGPISFATYMQMCLLHPTAGYYMRPANPVIGSQGDFITSPEISQVFGELLGVWLLSQWMRAGQSRRIRLVELGPGQGTLMHDVLRVFRQFPAPRAATKDIHLVETSASMRSTQEATLSPFARENGWRLEWHDAVDRIPHDAGMYTLVIAHEFFDALPFHLLEKTHQGWQEVLIASVPDPAALTILKSTADPSIDFSSASSSSVRLGDVAPRFRPVLSPAPTPSSTLLGLSSPRFQKRPVGSRVEVSPTSFKTARQIGELLRDEGSDGPQSAGSALIVDYGGDKVHGSSFRAFKDHKTVDVFHRPGDCDLTVNVDFTYLQEATADLATSLGPMSQAVFLQRMGLQARVNVLKAASKGDAARRAEIQHAADRLVDLTGMGAQYQVMALTGGLRTKLSDADRWPFVDM